jgi:hypothetical protein
MKVIVAFHGRAQMRGVGGRANADCRRAGLFGPMFSPVNVSDNK